MMTNAPNTNLWCHVCQRQFCSSSALFQHGKRLSHLKRAMRGSSSRCTTITNGKVTSSVPRSNPISAAISFIPSGSSSGVSVSSAESLPKEPIIIRRQRHTATNTLSYTCNLCSCRCWTIRNIHRHVRLHADVRPFHCNLCQMKFKSYANLVKHFKTSRHQLKKANQEKNFTVDHQALEEQNRLISQIQFVDDADNVNDENETKETDMVDKQSSPIHESDNLLEDLHIPDSRLIDGDAAELALIDPSTFEELHKAAECLLNLQGVFFFGEEENGSERIPSFSTT